jgi:hypothetical protein
MCGIARHPVRLSGLGNRISLEGTPRRFGDRKVGNRLPRLPTLRLSARLGVQFKLVRCYYAQRRAGHPRSNPSPLRGNFCWCN